MCRAVSGARALKCRSNRCHRADWLSCGQNLPIRWGIFPLSLRVWQRDWRDDDVRMPAPETRRTAPRAAHRVRTCGQRRAPPRLKLNKVDLGPTENTTAPSNRLSKFFNDREDNGIFREGTNRLRTRSSGDRPNGRVGRTCNLSGFPAKTGSSQIFVPVQLCV